MVKLTDFVEIYSGSQESKVLFQCPMPNALFGQCPMPNAPCPMPNALCQMSTSCY
ncbi:hypothetical protein QUB57_00550 [Microcoleus sp. F6_C1]